MIKDSMGFDAPKDLRLRLFEEHVNKLFVARRDGLDGFVHMALGITGEAGEFCDVVKKAFAYDADYDQEGLTEELGDLLWYIQGACILMEIDFYDLFAHNMNKLAKRYPAGWSPQAALERLDKK